MGGVVMRNVHIASRSASRGGYACRIIIAVALITALLQAAHAAPEPAPVHRWLKQALPSTIATMIETSVGGLETFGPGKLDPETRRAIEPPAELAYGFDPAGLAETGDGTATRPWIGAIARAVAQLEGRTGTLRLPPGHYEEDRLVVPTGVWLVGTRDVVLRTAEGGRGRNWGWIVTLEPGAGLVGVTVDGSFTGKDILMGVVAEPDSVVANTHVVDIPGIHGVLHKTVPADGQAGPWIVGNRVERAGGAGIRVDTDARVLHNTVLHCGGDTDWNEKALGNDGIIARDAARNVVIEHNLVVAAASTLGRHAIATQGTHGTVIRRNLCILVDSIRGGIVLADGTRDAQVEHNLVINTVVASPADTSEKGIHVNGNDNVVTRNAVVGTEWGVSLWAKSEGWGRGNRIVENVLVPVEGRAVPLMRYARNDTNLVSKNRVERVELRELASRFTSVNAAADALSWLESSPDVSTR